MLGGGLNKYSAMTTPVWVLKASILLAEEAKRRARDAEGCRIQQGAEETICGTKEKRSPKQIMPRVKVCAGVERQEGPCTIGTKEVGRPDGSQRVLKFRV